MTDFSLTKAKKPREHSLLSEMPADIAVNNKGQIMVLHHRPFAFTVDHVSYDPASGDITFVGADGTTQDFGMAAPLGARPHLEDAQEAALVLIDPKQEKIANFRHVPVVLADHDSTNGTIH